METIIIRDASETDIPAILDIYNDAILHTTSVYSEMPHTMEMRHAWYKERLTHNFPVFVAEQSGAVAGFSSFGYFRAWPCYRHTVELSVYVDASCRGNGIGKLLVKPLIDRAKQ